MNTAADALARLQELSARIEAAAQPAGSRMDSAVAVAVDPEQLSDAAQEAQGLAAQIGHRFPHLRRWSHQLSAVAARLLGELDQAGRGDSAPGWATGRRQPVLMASDFATAVVRHDAAQGPAQPAEPQWRPLMQGNRERAGIVTDGRGGWRRVG